MTDDSESVIKSELPLKAGRARLDVECLGCALVASSGSTSATSSAGSAGATTERKAKETVARDADGDFDIERPRQPAPALCERGAFSSRPVVRRVSAAGHGFSLELDVQTESELAGVGLQLWSGSLVLAEFVLAHRDLFRGCVAVELGGGLGLVSIVLAMPLQWAASADSASGSGSGSATSHVIRPRSKSDGEAIAAAVFCTDYAFGDVLSNGLRNCERNVGDRVRVREFDFLSSESDCTLLKLLASKSSAAASWLPSDKDAKSSVSWRQSDAHLLSASSGGGGERKAPAPAPAPLLLFAADVVYDDDLTEALVGKLKLLLAPAGPFKALYLSAEKRVVFTVRSLRPEAPAFDFFLGALRDQGLVAEELWSSASDDTSRSLPQLFDYQRNSCLVVLRVSEAAPAPAPAGTSKGAGAGAAAAGGAFTDSKHDGDGAR